MNKSSSFLRNLFILILIAGAGAAIYFGVKYLFFNEPDTQKPFEIVNDFATSDLYTGLEKNLLTNSGVSDSDKEANFAKLSVYEKAIYKAKKFAEGIPDDNIKLELNYTIGRLQDISSIHANGNNYLDYELKNILYLESKSELNPLISELARKASALTEAGNKLQTNITKTFEPYVSSLKSDYTVASTASYFNNNYLRSFTSFYISYITALTDLCVTAQDVISYSEKTLDTNEYRIQIYRVGANWANICATDLKNAYEEHSRNFENESVLEPDKETGKVSRTPEKVKVFELYQNFYNDKIKLMEQNTDLINNYKIKYDVKYTYEIDQISKVTDIQSSNQILAEGIEKLDLKNFLKNLYEIKIELEHIGTETKTDEPIQEDEDEDEDNKYLSEYLKGLEFMEATNCKETLARLIGKKV